MQEGVRRAAAQAAALRELEAPDTFLARSVEVRVVLVAGEARRLEHRVDERVHGAALGHAQRSADAWKASSPRSLSSERLKYGSTSSYPQPSKPIAAHSS